MRVVRRRVEVSSPGDLPREIAAGPVPQFWGEPIESARRAWEDAGRAWSREHGHGWNGWRQLLSEDVRYWESSLGRCHARALKKENRNVQR